MGDVELGASVAGGAAAGSAAGPWGTLGGAAIGALGSIAGGLFSNAANEEAVERQVNFQRESMQNGIRWRVADAKAAGLHPLFALGANLPTPTPIVLGDQLGPSMAEAGQQIGNAVAKFSDANARQREVLENALLYKQMEETDARRAAILSDTAIKENQYYASLDAAAKTNGLGVQSETGQVPNAPGGVGMIDLKPAEVTSHKAGRPDVSAGTNPAYEERWLVPGFPMLLPVAEGESPEEIISEMSWPAWAGLIMRNQNQYGEGWLRDMVELRYFGKLPKKTYKSIKQGAKIKK